MCVCVCVCVCVCIRCIGIYILDILDIYVDTYIYCIVDILDIYVDTYIYIRYI